MSRVIAILSLAAMSCGAGTTTLDEAAVRGLVALETPSRRSILQEIEPGDPARAPGDRGLRAALSNPDQTWSVFREWPSPEIRHVLVRDGRSWTTSSSDGALVVEGPLDTDGASTVASLLRLGGGEKTLAMSGALQDEELTLLRYLVAAPDGRMTGSALAARAMALRGMPSDTAALALRQMEEAGWIASEGEPPAWALMRRDEARALTAADDIVRVTRLDASGTSETAAFISSEAGTVVRTGRTYAGLASPRAAAAAALLSALPARTGAEAPLADAGVGGRRDTAAGDAILAELTRGIFRLGDAKSTRDAFGRGQVDSWRVDRLAEYIDTTGTGAIDWVRVDDFGEGRWTRSFVLQEERWQPSNILDVFLEIEFKLPWARDAYHPHDVEIQLNGTTISKLEDSLPEGFYRFQLRPQDLRIPAGAGSVNQVRLVTTHLRGGHYVVTTNFNLVFQLAVVQRWVIADSAEDADRILRASGNFTSGGRDAALYANEWAAVGAPPEAGKPVLLRGLVRNLGGEAIPGGRLVVRNGATEVAAVPLPSVGPADLSPAEIAVTLPAGVHGLTIHAEIEGDGRRANDAVPVVVRCGGDAKKPELTVEEPGEGVLVPAGNHRLAGTARDETALARLEISVNGGLWQAVAPSDRWEATVALQKGPNRIRVRAVDSSGNAVEIVRGVEGQ